MTTQFAEMTWCADNIVTADASSFESGAGGFTTVVNCSVSSASVISAFVQTKQLQLSSLAAGLMSATSASGTSGYPVVPGQTLTVVASMVGAFSRLCSVDIILYDSAGAVISTTVGATTAQQAAYWQRITNAVLVPAGAAYAALKLNVAGTAGAAELAYFDGVIAWGDSTGIPLASTFVYYPGDAATSKITSPDSAGLSPVGDLDIRVQAMMDSWVQTTGSLISKWDTTGNQRSFRVYIDASSKLNLDWSANGTAVITKTSTVALPVASGSQTWVRATLDVDNGAAGNTVTFYASADGTNWTQVGAAVVTAGTTSVFDSTSQIELGSHNAVGSQMTHVDFFDVQIYASINGSNLIADWTFDGLVQTATTTTDSFGNVLTLTANCFLSEWELGIGDKFYAYVIERSDDGGATWNTIARLTSINAHRFDDYEALRNTTATYRMRTESVDFAYSLYTAEGTSLPVYTQCGYLLTSNEDPTLNLEYLDSPDREYQFPDVAHEWQLYARDYAVVFRETENRGDVFTINFWLYMDGTPVTNNVPVNLTGRIAFQDLINLIRAPLSYVCVLDQDGNRWLAALLMDKSTATRKEPGGKYLFPIRVRQVTATPSEVATQT